MKQLFLGAAITIAAGAIVTTQQSAPAQTGVAQPAAAQTAARPASPAGTAHAQVSGAYVKDDQGRERYQGGKWIEITYSRPLKRGRDVFGSGADYGKALLVGGATVWRAGANVS